MKVIDAPETAAVAASKEFAGPDGALFAKLPALQRLWGEYGTAIETTGAAEERYFAVRELKPNVDNEVLKTAVGVTEAERVQSAYSSEWTALAEEMLAMPASTIAGMRLKAAFANQLISSELVLKSLLADLANIGGHISFWCDKSANAGLADASAPTPAGPVAALRNEYFSLKAAIDGHEGTDKEAEHMFDRLRAIDAELVAANPTSPAEAIALLEVARADFWQFNFETHENHEPADKGDAIVLSALDAALGVLRTIFGDAPRGSEGAAVQARTDGLAATSNTRIADAAVELSETDFHGPEREPV